MGAVLLGLGIVNALCLIEREEKWIKISNISLQMLNLF